MTFCKRLQEHMIEHELLDLETTVSGLTPSDLTILDDGLFIVSGVNTINFDDEISAEYDTVSGVVNISLENLNVDEGRLWVYDSSRSKWLSSDRLSAVAGRKGRSKNAYLRVHDGQAINLTGYRVPRNATITAISAQTRGDETWTLQVRKNGDSANIASLAMINVAGAHNATVNVNLDEGDRVQFFAETTAFFGIKDPFIWVEIAWRKENF